MHCSSYLALVMSITHHIKNKISESWKFSRRNLGHLTASNLSDPFVILLNPDTLDSYSTLKKLWTILTDFHINFIYVIILFYFWYGEWKTSLKLDKTNSASEYCGRVLFRWFKNGVIENGFNSFDFQPSKLGIVLILRWWKILYFSRNWLEGWAFFRIRSCPVTS